MHAHPGATLKPLADDDLDQVSGGMKWTRGTRNPDVIDARGGQIKMWFGTFTLDKGGKISGFTPA